MKLKFIYLSFPLKKRITMTIMRLFIFFSCMSTFGFSAFSGFSQNAKIEIASDKTVSIRQVFDMIHNQTGYTFIYQSGLFNQTTKMDLKKGTTRVNKLLNKILNPAKFNYQFTSDGTIVVTKQFLQEIAITGIVTDAKGLPLPGVVITVVNTEGKITRGTITNIDGKYKITGTKGYKIVFSYLGFDNQEFDITDQEIINVALEKSIINLDEILVTGYQKLSRERATGSFELLSSENDLDNRVFQSNIFDKLEGSVSGLLIEGNTISIRGVNTFNSNIQPLIVIDGFPVEGSEFFRNDGNARSLTSLVNSDDVESITVLKDAAAASIWGARASNGIIVITTKKAKKGDVKVNFSSRFSIQELTNWNKAKYASTSDIIDARLFGLENGFGLSSDPTNPRDEVHELWFRFNTDLISQAQFNTQIELLKKQNYRKNFQKAFQRNRLKKEYNLNVSGGSKSHTFYISGKYIDNNETRKDSDNRDINFNLKNDFNIGEKIKINTTVNVKRINSERGSLNTGRFRAYTRFTNPDNTPTVIQTGYNNDYKNSFTNIGYINWDFIPLEDINLTKITQEDTDLRFQISLDVELLKGLKLYSGFQYENNVTDNLTISDKEAYRNRDFYNTYTLNSPNPDGSVNLTPQVLWAGSRNDRHSVVNNYTWRNQLNFIRDFNKHKINALAGIEVRKLLFNVTDPPELRGYNDDLLSDANYNLNDIEDFEGSTTNIASSPTLFQEEDRRYLSYYANIGYTFDNKYDITGSYRLDLTNFFGVSPEFKYRPLWSSGLGWNISNENFFNVPWVNNLKLRTTYGVNGNSSLNSSPFLLILSSNNRFFNSYPSAGIISPPNPNLRWEKTEVTNLGLDFSLFNNRLSGSVEYYYKYSSDLIAQVPNDYTSGFSLATLNTSELSNRGIDINLNYRVLDNDFKWNLSYNFAWNKGKVEKYLLNPPTGRNLLSSARSRIVGDPINALYAYRWGGLNEMGDPTFFKADGTRLDATNTNFGDDPEDATFIGSRTPTIFGGLRNFFSYKNFTLSTYINYQMGHYKQVPTVNVRSVFDGGTEIHEDLSKVWKNPGDELVTDVPRLLDNTTLRLYQRGDHLVAKGDEIFLQEISLGYSIPSRHLNNTRFKALRFSLHANNLGYIYVAKNTNLTPFLATYTFNINFNF